MGVLNLAFSEPACPECIGKIKKGIKKKKLAKNAEVHFEGGNLKISYCCTELKEETFERAVRSIVFKSFD